jgi:murein DD-endopeptidase MepM/ murein hydrolase activator NlpD
MKTILKIVIGIFLGLPLASGLWLVGCVPQGQSVTLRPPPTAELIQVNVMGAVKHPGVYELEENSRVADAVEAAGGFVTEADKRDLNLAAFVVNAQRLNIPFAAGYAPDEVQDSALVTGEIPSPLVSNDHLDISSATPTEMDNLPDIDPTIVVTSTVTRSCSIGAVGNGHFVWPADNHYLSGNDYGAQHLGIDIAAGEGSPVYAADSGVITAMGNDQSGYGNVIQIKHGNSYFTAYAHLSMIEVSMCQSVYAGQRIGAAGDTGNSRGVHLHFEVIQDGRSINPWLVLP